MTDRSTIPTQNSRRIRFGANVLTASLAAFGILIFVNLLAFYYLTRTTPIDLTATGQYSLSPQTRKLLSNLDADYEVVTLFSSTDPVLEPAEISRTADLIDQYARQTNRLKVTHIQADTQTGRTEAFLKKIHDRYEAQLLPLQEALNAGKETLTKLREPVAKQRVALLAILSDSVLTDAELKKFLRATAQAFGRLDGDLESVNKQINKALTGTLPAYAEAKTAMENILVQLNDRGYLPLIRQCEQAAKKSEMPEDVRQKLLSLIQQFRQTSSTLETSLKSIRQTSATTEYDQVREQLNTHTNPVVIFNSQQMRVLWLGAMFRKPGAVSGSAADLSGQRLFLGEEQITGTIVGMSLSKPPLVTFVTSSPASVLGPQGEYNTVAQRLQNLRFTVKTWNPASAGRPTMDDPTGEHALSNQAPQPEPGQKAVWVILPTESANPLGMGVSSGEQQIAGYLRERLQHNESALVILSASPTSQFGDTNPLVPLLADWGIHPQLDRVIFREITTADGKARPFPQFQVSVWPAELPITQALAGLTGGFFQASPILLEPPVKNPGVAFHPLVKLTGSSLWAAKNFEQYPDIQRDPASPATSEFTVAAAAAKGESRLVVVADPAWASDQITDFGLLGPNTASITSARFPANAELFVNSITWLAGLDHLIAASARTQDIRRVQSISTAGLSYIQWGLTLGLPAITTAIGVLVWLKRRQA